MFRGHIYLYTRDRRPRLSFWIMITALLVAFFGAALWLFIPWAWWADRDRAVRSRS